MNKKQIADFIQNMDDKDQSYFWNGIGLDINKKILISKTFPSLDLVQEQLYLFYQNEENKILIAITKSNLYLFHDSSTQVAPLLAFKGSLSDKIQIPESHRTAIESFINQLVTGKNEIKDLSKSILEEVGDGIAKINIPAIKNFTNQIFDKILNNITPEEKAPLENKNICTVEQFQSMTQIVSAIRNFLHTHQNSHALQAAAHQISIESDKQKWMPLEYLFIHDFIYFYKKSAKNNFHKALLAYLCEQVKSPDTPVIQSQQDFQAWAQNKDLDAYSREMESMEIFKIKSDYQNQALLPLLTTAITESERKTFLEKYNQLLQLWDLHQDSNLTQQVQNPTPISGVEPAPEATSQTLEEVMAELDELIGLKNIKTSIQEFTDFLKVQKMREDKGLKAINNSLHTVFVGPPGTGKTTIARILAKIYCKLGYLSKGHLVETDRAGLVAGYVGQTAIKTDEIIRKANEGVLFIDEAYGLAKGDDGGNDFGNEAIEILLKRMEDQRDNFVVIVAGYPDEMKEFINSNPGLHSRFNRYFTFEHYTPTELIQIFELYCTKNDFILSASAKEKLTYIAEKLYEQRNKGFGNARTMRNLFEKIVEYQATRIVKIKDPDETILKTIEEQDIPEINKTVDEILSFTAYKTEKEKAKENLEQMTASLIQPTASDDTTPTKD